MSETGNELQLGLTEIRAYQEQTYGTGPVGGGGYNDISKDPILIKITANIGKTISDGYKPLINKDASDQETEYAAKRQLIAADLQKEVEDDKRASGIGPGDRVANLTSEITTVDKIISQTNQQIASLQPIADSFYKGNFFGQPINAFIREATKLELYHESNRNYTYDNWRKSLLSAYQLKRLADVIELATRQKAWLTLQLEEARITAQAAEAVRASNRFRTLGPASATGPVVITAAGTVNVIEAAAVTLQAAIRSAIAELTSLLAGTASGLLVGVSALIYSPKLANGELPERYTFSTPLSDLEPGQNHDLSAIASAGGTVNLPVRLNSKTAADGQSEIIVVMTDGTTIPSSVRVVVANYDAAQNVYSVTTGDTPPRNLTWTPIFNPGNNSTTLPAEQPALPVYTGATVTPVEGRIDTFPGVADADFDDFITVFPADSGLPPIYVMFRDRREDPGVVSGVGQLVSGIWLGTASQGEGAPIPSQIADQLRGKEFKNFRGFREAFWKAVANEPELAKQFDPGSVAAMKKGYAPFVRKIERAGARKKYELHHKNYISTGGNVFDIENVNVITPKRHIETHQENK
ncbi:S-type pyocin domain-containing protein [Pseudomonas sp. GXZC]|uniref:S-type pyocin domain-containing protein n=1 Tax=Pseudomonas sp. GXZC TaxID=3003351 RepID=UPI002ED47DEA